jgi:hypothetical protein
MNRPIGVMIVVAGAILIGFGLLVYTCDALVWENAGRYQL